MGATSEGILERGMGAALRALQVLAGSDLLDRLGARKGMERVLFRATRDGVRSAARASRTFTAVQRLARPARQSPVKSGGLFDITPDDEQQMLQEAVRSFAAEKVRPVARDADAALATPEELLAELTELGVGMLGVPEQLGGVIEHQAAVTGALVGIELAHGDLGIAFAALAPGAAATAIGRWGDSEQQAAYLPAFAGESPPAAALAMLEPAPLFNPLLLRTTARRDGADWVIDGVKSLLARAQACELFVVAAQIEGSGVRRPGLFIVESSTRGLSIQAEPSMGLRPASTGRLCLEGARVPAGALLAEGAPDVYAECVHRSRIAWCALATGTAKAVLDYVIPYVNERVAFGEPISNRQAVAFTVANIGIESESMRLLTLAAASRADTGRQIGRQAALARRLCAAKGMQIGSDGVQLLGGHGYVKEHPVERWYRDLRAVGVIEGALLL